MDKIYYKQFAKKKGLRALWQQAVYIPFSINIDTQEVAMSPSIFKMAEEDIAKL